MPSTARISTAQKTALTLLTGLALVGSLAGCSTAVEEPAVADTVPADEATTESTETTAPESTETDTADSSSTYTDGTYTETGSYQTPNGTESIEVTVTLEGDIVTAVTVVSEADNRDSEQYQSQFISGIEAVVVGQDIDSLSVSRVAGSSLTSGGFNSAIDAIKSDAS